MASKQRVKAPKSCRECENWGQVQEKIRVAELLEKMIQAIEAQVQKGEVKATTAEYLKLIQLQKEFDQDEAKEITVTWINPSESPETE
jgi:hypothetical protein